MMKTKLHAAWRRINAVFPKKLLASGLCALVLLGSPAQAPGINQTPSEDMLRLHVVAASDSAQDQALKLQLRDRLLPIIQGYIQEARSARPVSYTHLDVYKRQEGTLTGPANEALVTALQAKGFMAE